MTITFTRTYDRAQVAKSQDGLRDVVLSIYCNLSATDGTYSAVAGETIALDPPEATQFVPFDQITQDLVDSWVLSREQYIKLEEKLTAMIEEQKNPPVVTVSLPFNVPPIVDPVITEVIPETNAAVAVDPVVEANTVADPVVEANVASSNTP